MKDLYSILEINKKATTDEIKQSYHKLAFKYHPDKNKNNKESNDKFKEISEAYEILSDPTKKKQFDTHGYESLTNLSSPLDLFSSLFGSQVNQLDGLGGAGGVFMFAKNMMPTPHKQQQVKKTPTMKYNVNVSLQDLYYGTTKDFSIKHKLKDESIKKTKYDINVKPGSKHGNSIHVKDGGNYLDKLNLTEDLEIIIQCKEHPTIKRFEDDLFISKEISLSESLCNCILSLDFFEELHIESNEVIQPNSIMMIQDKGMPIKDSKGEYGDLYIEFKINYPEFLSQSEQEQIKDIWVVTELEEDSEIDPIEMKYFGTKEDYMKQKKEIFTSGNSMPDNLLGELGEGLSDCITQ